MNKISGPVSLYYLKSNNKKIIMVGDSHYSLNNMCKTKNTEFHLFLDKFLKRTAKTIDYFIEYGFNKDIEEYEKDTYIIVSTDFFLKKKYPNLRFHFSDIRKIPEVTGIKYYMKLISMLELSSSDKNFDKNIYVKNINKFLDFKKFLKMFFNKKKMLKLNNDNLKTEKIKKQLDKCDLKTRTTLKKIFLEQNDKILTSFYKSRGDSIKELIDNSKILNINKKIILEDNNFIKNLNILTGSIKLFLENYISNSMDIYILARMFKKTDNKENIIIHAGNAHILQIIKVLTMSFNFKKISEIKENKGSRCLDISKFNMEFFE